MSSGEIGTSSFEFYEGIRILIPGAACVALYGGVVATFGLDAPLPTESIASSVLGALIVGLLLYFIDFPSFSAAFRNRLPHGELQRFQLPDWLNQVNFYFVLLDSDIPTGIRNRALYMGSMFRIGFELTYLLFMTAVCVISIALLVPSAGEPRPSGEIQPVLWVALALFVGLTLLALSLDLLRAMRKNREGEKGGNATKFSILAEDATRSDPLGFLLTLGLLLAYGCSGFEPLGGAAIGVPLAVWAARYQRGYPHGKGRRPCPRSIAVGWLSLAGGMVCAVALTALPETSALSVSEAIAWLATALFAGGIVVSRGPEKKIMGSYSTQRTWLALHEARVRKYLEERS